MKPINFAQANQVLSAPDGWDKTANGECGDLHVINNGHCIVSCWHPSPEELALLNQGGAILIMVYGQNHPPLQVSAAGMDYLETPEDKKGSPEEIINKLARKTFANARTSSGKTVN